MKHNRYTCVKYLCFFCFFFMCKHRLRFSHILPTLPHNFMSPREDADHNENSNEVVSLTTRRSNHIQHGRDGGEEGGGATVCNVTWTDFLFLFCGNEHNTWPFSNYDAAWLRHRECNSLTHQERLTSHHRPARLHHIYPSLKGQAWQVTHRCSQAVGVLT